MTDEKEMLGVYVWLAGTIYVPAESLEEAEKLVARRYAGTISIPQTYDLQDGEDLPLEGEDFMSSAITLYGICSEAVVKPRDTQSSGLVPEMLSALESLLSVVKDALQDDSIDASTEGGAILCGDVMANALFRAQTAIAKANVEGRTDA